MEISMEKKNSGKFKVRFHEGFDYEINCHHFYIQDGFFVIRHKDGDIEYFPVDKINFIVQEKEDLMEKFVANPPAINKN